MDRTQVVASVINVPLVLILRQLTGVFMLYSIYFVR
nr:MAG TPA: hypothetical protein [Caudoviricetes sp.]